MEPTWEDVENYFDGPECLKCSYIRGNDEGDIWCGLAITWDGVGREPLPSDCRGVNRVED